MRERQDGGEREEGERENEKREREREREREQIRYFSNISNMLISHSCLIIKLCY